MIVETLLIGLVLALVWAELTDVSPGGIIVAGYFALYLDRPLRVAATLAVALVAWAVVRALSRQLILFGRRRFVLTVLVGAVLSQAWLLAAPRLFAGPVETRVIGWIVPGILASSLARQKPLPTLASLAAVSTLTYAVARLVAVL
ncbi:MAG: poly-gamma-glutamate biosynthesis protein PgsC [Acidobacteria bacterium]|jgi:poly-gamma-glutamate biosynthesis protein PgsC/CapC|nr:poly-gamma-glutamate biosynthesis protein PgsC [Acidobacteriota bacterium]